MARKGIRNERSISERVYRAADGPGQGELSVRYVWPTLVPRRLLEKRISLTGWEAPR